MKRRELLQNLAATGTLLAPPLASAQATDKLGDMLPLRTLGRTGEKVTCIGLGGFHVGHADSESKAQAIVEQAMESGIRFYDNAESYQRGLAEERYGKYLIPSYRDQIFLMTKTQARNAAEAKKDLEESLRRLNTDVIDLWQLHSLNSPEDTDDRLAAGVFEEALKAQAAGKIRHLGFTGHRSPYAQTRMLEHKEVLKTAAACQIPINPVDAAAQHSFIDHVVPQMLDNKIGILAMKTLADGRFFSSKERNGRTLWTSENPLIPNTLSIEECITFALSLPISVLITGCDNPEHVKEKADIARRFTALDAEKRLAVIDKVVSFAEEGQVEYYKDKTLRTGTRKT